MDYRIGKKMKELRTYLHLTQGELAKGICTQAMVSKMEKGNDVYPSAQLLYQISQRLGVSIEYFFSDDDLPHISYVNDVCDQLTELIRSKQFEEAYEIVKFEKKNPTFSNKPHLKRFLLWREAICVNYLHGEKDEAVRLLDEALTYAETSVKNYSLEELDILTSKAIILGEMEGWQRADELYTEILKYVKKIPWQKDKSTILNIYYNASRTAYKLGNYERALHLAEEGIKVCKKEKTLYLMGYLYYQMAESQYAIDQALTEQADVIYTKALMAFQQLDDERNYELVKKRVVFLKEE
ncbi:helix-turn-helix domain-containing protein [Alkalihalophilus marmarensis]|uniref:helix-turn-helix domain-containing protein n=1 Tax=Alkalihalophilus marmarensis TaxID=521377 RepID=UPI002DBBB5A4|nr:helix-turn-helix domain-containing protein [Alkalihalophilus marmarensis]MEC2071329.1 helix-turn-helix domain-containing protein [Alkalihalophilus marmarensis]